MAIEACSHFNCMVADLTGENSFLLEIQDIERLIQSSQFHFLPSVLLPTPICRQLSYLNFMQACIHPKGNIIQCKHQRRENYTIAHFHFSVPICFSLYSPVWAAGWHTHALTRASTQKLTWIKAWMSPSPLNSCTLNLRGSALELCCSSFELQKSCSSG